MRALMLASALMAGAALSAAPAYAQPVSQPAAPNGNIAGFMGGPNALPRAIERIEGGAGGQVIEIRFDRKAGAPGYDAVVAKGGRLLFLRAERAGPATVMVARSEPVWMQGWKKRRDVHLAERAKVSLPQAIETAEKAGHGAPAVAAGIARSASNPASDVHAYNVLLDLGKGQTRRVAVDSQTGQVISDPSALAYWP